MNMRVLVLALTFATSFSITSEIFSMNLPIEIFMIGCKESFEESVHETEGSFDKKNPVDCLLTKIQETKDPLTQDESGNTVLHYLLGNAHDETVSACLMMIWLSYWTFRPSFQKNPTRAIPSSGTTEDCVAFFQNLDSEMVDSLKSLLDIKNNSGKTPIDIANDPENQNRKTEFFKNIMCGAIEKREKQ